MTDDAPVPYPTNGFAYPVAKPVASYAPPVPAFAQSAVPDTSAQETPAVSKLESLTPAQLPVDSPVLATPEQKFFPLVPTETSKFVSPGSVVDASEERQTVAPQPVVEQSDLLDEIEVDVDNNVVPTAVEPAELLESPFDISSSLTREPQTNSIVLDEIPDALTSSDILMDAGQILATGSIELPTLTGEIKIVSDSPNADIADDLDSASVTISTVAPVRAPSVINSKAQLGVLPSKRRKNQGQLMAMLTLAIMIVTVGTLYAMASILGFIK